MKELSIIISNWNTRELLHQCLTSIFYNPISYDFDVWVIDNASTDNSVLDICSSFPEIKLIENSENLGFARANNQALKQAEGMNYLLLNPDTIVYPNAINLLVEYLTNHPQVAAVGPRLLNADGSLQISASPAPSLGREIWRLFHLDRLIAIGTYQRSFFETESPKVVDVLLGACFLVRRDIIQKIGLFDENYFVYSEEVDLCERIRKTGLEIHWIPWAVVTHFGGMSTRQVSEKMFLELYRNKIKFFRKHHGTLQADLYKVVLRLAASARISSCWILGNLPVKNRSRWSSISRNYLALMHELGRL